MAQYDDREKFIPVTKQELVTMLSKDEEVPAEDREKFANFCKILQSLYHFEYHEELEKLKHTYAPFDPDRDTLAQLDHTPEEEKEMLVRLVESFGEACEGANFEKMSDEELNEAFEGWSPFGGINLKLDLNHYVEYALYYRGATMEKREVRLMKDMIKFDFKKKPIEVKIYKRLAILAKVREAGRSTKKFDTKNVYIKLFKNVPALDLEMLFPTTKPALKKLDMFQIYLPILLGVIILTAKTLGGFFAGVSLGERGIKAELNPNDTHLEEKLRDGRLEVLQVDANEKMQPVNVKGGDGKVSDESVAAAKAIVLETIQIMDLPASAENAARKKARLSAVDIQVKGDFSAAITYGLLAGGIVALLTLFASWTMKSVFKFLQSKQKYTGILAQNLFFLNLDNNAGVFAALIDAAEEEECKEAFFAAFFLNKFKTHPETGQKWTEEALDDYIERWIENNLKDPKTGEGVRVDFEIDDALGKLERLNLLVKNEDGTLEMKDWDAALEQIDEIWDNFFEYNNAPAA